MTTDIYVNETETATKTCAICSARKPLSDFLRRSGTRDGVARRRGTCRACRLKQGETSEEMPAEADVVAEVSFPAGSEATEKPKRKRKRRKRGKGGVAPEERSIPEVTGEAEPEIRSETVEGPVEESEAEPPKRKRKRRKRGKAGAASKGPVSLVPIGPSSAPSPKPIKPMRSKHLSARPFVLPMAMSARESTDASGLRPTRLGFIRMRGKTDNGRRWYQEVEPELAITLVKERAAVVVNRHTIRRIYSNKEFRRLILERDEYTCYFCGQYGDTIDHLLPRAKGGHTTPDNCVCACNECNQSKADRDLEEFIGVRE
ncbi:HNH endonuclease [Cohnella suwonensis]|uniref:HNH endonuclease n=1 Tax=Cohnella suwonensis TaxID=696072 RepID=A0ABW0LXW4_9BACL